MLWLTFLEICVILGCLKQVAFGKCSLINFLRRRKMRHIFLVLLVLCGFNINLNAAASQRPRDVGYQPNSLDVVIGVNSDGQAYSCDSTLGACKGAGDRGYGLLESTGDGVYKLPPVWVGAFTGSAEARLNFNRGNPTMFYSVVIDGVAVEVEQTLRKSDVPDHWTFPATILTTNNPFRNLGQLIVHTDQHMMWFEFEEHHIIGKVWVRPDECSQFDGGMSCTLPAPGMIRKLYVHSYRGETRPDGKPVVSITADWAYGAYSKRGRYSHFDGEKSEALVPHSVDEKGLIWSWKFNAGSELLAMTLLPRVSHQPVEDTQEKSLAELDWEEVSYKDVDIVIYKDHPSMIKVVGGEREMYLHDFSARGNRYFLIPELAEFPRGVHVNVIKRKFDTILKVGASYELEDGFPVWLTERILCKGHEGASSDDGLGDHSVFSLRWANHLVSKGNPMEYMDLETLRFTYDGKNMYVTSLQGPELNFFASVSCEKDGPFCQRMMYNLPKLNGHQTQLFVAWYEGDDREKVGFKISVFDDSHSGSFNMDLCRYGKYEPGRVQTFGFCVGGPYDASGTIRMLKGELSK